MQKNVENHHDNDFIIFKLTNSHKLQVYKRVDVPSDASSTTGCSPPCLSLQFMLFSNNYHFFHLLILLLNLNSSFSTTGYQQSTRLDLGWQDDPCLPSPWEKIECEGSLIASLYVQSIHFFSLPFLNILVFLFQWRSNINDIFQGSFRHKFEID